MTDVAWQASLGAFFFGLSMLFSASETALMSLSRPRLKKLISQRRPLATAFLEWLATPQYLLTTILIGNTLSNVLATVLAAHLAIRLLPGMPQEWVEMGAWFVMLVLLFIFGELVPKIVARHYPERVSVACLRWVSRLNRLLTPLLRKGLLVPEKLFPRSEGDAAVGRLSVYSLEEIREMIAASVVQGVVAYRSRQMMEKALDLHPIAVSRIMTPFEKMEAVHLALDAEKILDQVAEAGRTRIPAYRLHPRKIDGYLHVKDLLHVWRGNLPLAWEALLRKPFFVRPTYLAGDLLEDFRKGVSHMAVVINGEGDCQGIVTLEDVLEEIVGEILDEYDLEDPRGFR